MTNVAQHRPSPLLGGPSSPHAKTVRKQTAAAVGPRYDCRSHGGLAEYCKGRRQTGNTHPCVSQSMLLVHPPWR
eukprot:9418322-Pyramimonas_sp.AAC.1